MAKMATVLVFQMVVKMLHIGRKKKKCLQCLSIKKLFQNNKDWNFFFKNLRGRRKKGCCLRKGLPPPPTIETCLFKKKTHYFAVLNGHNIRFFGYEFIKLRFNREIVNSNKKGI